MANATSGNKIFVDSTGNVSDQVTTKITYILFTPNAAADVLILREAPDGPDCLRIKRATADSAVYDFSRKPLVFNTGVYVQQISNGAVATLVTSKGSD